MTAETICEKCGVPIGAPHQWHDNDCILDHADHTQRFVGLICKRHYHWIAATLTQIEELFTLLSVMPNTGQIDSRPSGDVEAPPPGRLDVMALTDQRNNGTWWPRVSPTPEPMTYERNWNGRTLEPNPERYPDILTILGGWVRCVIEERPIDPAALPDFLPLSAMLSMLSLHRHWIAQQPWIDDYVIELHDVHLALARGARDSMWPSSIGKCPNCANRLYNTIGVDEVTCTRCKSSWTGVDLIRLRLILEQDKEEAG